MAAVTGGVLALNAGSSSMKFAVFEGEEAVVRGDVSGLGGGTPEVAATGPDGGKLERPALSGASHDDLLPGLMDWLNGHARVAAVGHRVVHGGTRFHRPEPVTPDLLRALEELVPLAPLHQPHSLAGMRAAGAARPELPQVACFDTAFHAGMPEVAVRLPIPRELHEAGVRRYGFHGLSYEWVAGRLHDLDAELWAGLTVVAHLGSGASLCLMQRGRSLGTTMGFTALDGLMMGTRPGSLDPGVAPYLMRMRGMSAEAVEDLFYHRCGLLGVSGVSGDVRKLRADAGPAAREALALFLHRLLAEIGGLAATAGGLDGIVFTGGIGEHDAALRAECCRRLAWLGVRLDAERNEAAGRDACRITEADSPVRAWMIPADEEAVIARHVREVVASV